MDQIYVDARRGAVEARVQLEALESSNGRDVALSEALQAKLEVLSTSTNLLGQRLYTEPPARRELWRQRIAQLADELEELRREQARFEQKARSATAEARMRKELLGSGGAQNGGGAAGPNGAVSIAIDSHAAERQSMDNSSNIADQILATGTASLEMLFAQRSTLKGARKKLLDTANQMGMSKDLIRRIERHEITDTYLVIGGFALCVLFIVLVLVLRRH